MASYYTWRLYIISENFSFSYYFIYLSSMDNFYNVSSMVVVELQKTEFGFFFFFFLYFFESFQKSWNWIYLFIF